MHATESQPRYLVFTGEQDTSLPTLSLPVGEPEAEYLRNTVVPALQPLHQADYIEGAQGILTTMARHSYVLWRECVYWCIEWNPGLLIIEFSPPGDFRWCAFRSPNPEFGGRAATEKELDQYDEDARNPQYNMVFTAWDAQTDEYWRQGWSRISSIDQQAWISAMRRATEIETETSALSESEREALLRRCKLSAIWHGREPR